MKCKNCRKEAMDDYSICSECYGKKINPEPTAKPLLHVNSEERTSGGLE